MAIVYEPNFLIIKNSTQLNFINFPGLFLLAWEFRPFMFFLELFVKI
jgi:hypothetical protein